MLCETAEDLTIETLHASPPSIPLAKPRGTIVDTLSQFKYISPTKPTRPSRNTNDNLRCTIDDGELPRIEGEVYADTKPGTERRLEPSHERGISCSTTSSSSPRRKRTKNDVEGTLPPIPRTPKKRAKPRPYAPPEKYEHLHYLQDYLEPYQKLVFCGINPGYQSGQTGLYYAHSTNHFWQCLHLSGLTDQLLTPEEAHLLPEVYSIGLTNLVDRPTAEQSELSTEEMKAGVPYLMDKLVKYRPRTVCFLGRAIWDTFRQQAFKLKHPKTSPSPRRSSGRKATEPQTSDVWAPPSSPRSGRGTNSKYFTSKDPYTPSSSLQRTGRDHAEVHTGSQASAKDPFEWGLQPYKVVYPRRGEGSSTITETSIFVAPSPSARVVAYQWWDKVKFFERLRHHVSTEGSDFSLTTFTPIPLTTTKSIYFTFPHE